MVSKVPRLLQDLWAPTSTERNHVVGHGRKLVCRAGAQRAIVDSIAEVGLGAETRVGAARTAQLGGLGDEVREACLLCGQVSDLPCSTGSYCM